MNSGPFLQVDGVLAFLAATPNVLSAAERTTNSPTGTWGIDDSKEAELRPSVGRYKVPVAGPALRRSAVLPAPTRGSLLPSVTSWRLSASICTQARKHFNRRADGVAKFSGRE